MTGEEKRRVSRPRFPEMVSTLFEPTYHVLFILLILRNFGIYGLYTFRFNVIIYDICLLLHLILERTLSILTLCRYASPSRLNLKVWYLHKASRDKVVPE